MTSTITSPISPISLLSNTSYTQKEVLLLLSTLTDCSPIDPTKWSELINNLPKNHNIFVYTLDNKLIGMITIIIEQKLIHGCSCVAHIEDLVVIQEYRGSGIGKNLLDFAKIFAKNNNCYKIILNCDNKLIQYYEKNRFKECSVQMRLNI